MLTTILRLAVLTTALAVGVVAAAFGLAPGSAHAAPACPTPLVADTVLAGDCDGNIVVAASNIQINLAGHTVTGTGLGGGTGFLLDGVSGVHLHSGTITGFDVAVLLVNADNNHLNELTITGNTDGIVLSGSDFNHINGSFVNVNKGVGVSFTSSNDNAMNTMEIIHNRGPRFPSGGVRLVDSHRNKITSSLVLRDGEAGVFLQDSSYNKLLGLTVNRTNEQAEPGPGIQLSGNSDNNTIQSNVAKHNSYGIILMAGANANKVQSNETALNFADGIALQLGATANTVKSNYSHDNAVWDLSDGNATCANTWTSNVFGTRNQSCIF